MSTARGVGRRVVPKTIVMKPAQEEIAQKNYESQNENVFRDLLR
jgi:hypothetical protein